MKKKKITSKEKHQFEEERAKELLAYIFPEKYKNALLQESPDIYVPSLEIGVEVTDSMKKAVQEKASWLLVLLEKHRTNYHLGIFIISKTMISICQYSQMDSV